MPSKKPLKDILSDPKVWDELRLEDNTVVTVLNRHGKYGHEIDIQFSNEPTIYQVTIDDFRKFYYYLLERDCSKKTPQEMCDNPEEGDLVNTFLYGVIEVLRVNDRGGIVISLFKNNRLTTISIDHFKEIVDPSLRSIHEIMANPWPGSIINTKTYGKIEIIDVNGGGEDSTLKILIIRSMQNIQMTFREFHRRYMDDVIV